MKRKKNVEKRWANKLLGINNIIIQYILIQKDRIISYDITAIEKQTL